MKIEDFFIGDRIRVDVNISGFVSHRLHNKTGTVVMISDSVGKYTRDSSRKILIDFDKKDGSVMHTARGFLPEATGYWFYEDEKAYDIKCVVLENREVGFDFE